MRICPICSKKVNLSKRWIMVKDSGNLDKTVIVHYRCFYVSSYSQIIADVCALLKWAGSRLDPDQNKILRRRIIKFLDQYENIISTFEGEIRNEFEKNPKPNPQRPTGDSLAKE